MNKWIVAFFLLSCSYSCSSPKNGLRVAASAVPHAQMLEHVKPLLAEQGINLVIMITDDYNLPNRALQEKEIAANFFQHQPFLDEQIKEFGYLIESIAAIEIEPMGIYSQKITSLADLKDQATLVIPNDPTNAARALRLLETQGLIQINQLNPTVLNIAANPKHLQFFEVDAAMTARALPDVDAALINTNYALEAGLIPTKDALALESKDSPYANLLVVRVGEETRPEIQALKNALTSASMRDFLQTTYQGEVLPAF